MTPERLRRIFKEVDVDNDGRLPLPCLVDSLRRYDLAAQEQDVTDTLTKLEEPVERRRGRLPAGLAAQIYDRSDRGRVSWRPRRR